MIKTRHYINEYCSISRLPQDVVVYFETEENSIKKLRFECNSKKCEHKEFPSCEVFQKAFP